MGRTRRNTIDQGVHAPYQNLSSAGFTLLEVMLAVAILAMVSLGLYQASMQIMNTQEVVEERDEGLHELYFALQKMAQDLNSAYILKGRDFVSPEIQNDLAFIGAEDRLDFVSFANTRYIENAQESDSAEISYYLEKNPEHPEQMILMRRQANQIDEDQKIGGVIYPLLTGIQRLRFEYLPDTSNEDEEWRRTWDSLSLDNNNKLPRLVKVEMDVLLPGDEEAKTYSAVMPIRLIDPIIF